MAPTPRYPNKNRETAVQAFVNGATPSDLCKAGFTKGSVYKWWNAWKAEQTPEVEAVEVPPAIKSPTDPTPPGKPGAGITEQTAGLLLTMGFGMWAALAKNDLCYLTPAEKSQLQGPFAQTLRTIPNPVAELVNTYAPPVAFVTLLIEVVGKKQEQMREARVKQYDPMRQREEHVRAQEERAAPVQDDAPPAQVASENGRSTGTAEPESPTAFQFG